MHINAKVSIITPCYNSEKYILETIQSVIKQTYQNWEMIIVDDCSSDNTCSIVEEILNKEKRIKLVRLNNNSGAAISRNTALKYCSGRFIAYLDADDIWYPEKLSKQVEFMMNNGCGFSCTSYEVINNEGTKLNKNIRMKKRLDYRGFLINNLIQTVGVMVDLDKVPISCIEMPNMRRRQDAATWLQILKSGYDCYGTNEILAMYRRTEGSLSSNKIKAVKGVWYLYRNVERLSFIFSTYCFIRYALLAVWKRVYINKYFIKKDCGIRN